MIDSEKPNLSLFDKIACSIFVILAIAGMITYFLDSQFRTDVNSILQNYHMGVCVKWAEGTDWSEGTQECEKWGGF